MGGPERKRVNVPDPFPDPFSVGGSSSLSTAIGRLVAEETSADGGSEFEEVRQVVQIDLNGDGATAGRAPASFICNRWGRQQQEATEDDSDKALRPLLAPSAEARTTTMMAHNKDANFALGNNVNN